MELSLSPILITLGLIFTNYAIIVQSAAQKEVKIAPGLPQPPPPPARPPSSPPPKSPPPITPPAVKRHPPPASAPSPPKKRHPSPNRFHNKSSDYASHRRRPPQPLKKHERSLNTGEIIGFLFAGIAAILQIGVAGFLVFKRRQLLKINDRYETFSS